MNQKRGNTLKPISGKTLRIHWIDHKKEPRGRQL
ncbi:hypothetical protein GCK32_019842 [Trichostrongylus colubriformis]|uniref:Uncharacterized protein n=1 Tax=Trichostrongylus colubriformis TaxID=6319 RepID=A0AAN8FIL7_TRICO